MSDDRYSRGTHWRGDDNSMKYQNGDYGSGRNYGSRSARDYEASGAYDRDEGRGRDRGGRYASQDRYGQREYGNSGYGGSSYDRDQGRGSYGSRYGNDRDQGRYGSSSEYHGSYASDGRRFEDVGDRRDWDDDNRRSDRDRMGGYGQERSRYGNRDSGRDMNRGRGGYGSQPEGYNYQDRGFLDRAGDEVRSWFGDDEAERRREMDSRYDEREYARRGNTDRDHDYHSWRGGQIAALDRDYDEYRQENRSKFHNEFSTWRSSRQSQRDSLDKVQEHAEVVGSDGSHVGTVDKVRGDRILLTKNDVDAGGQHHSIPSRWIDKVEDKKVTLSKTADEAKQQWRDEEKNQAMFQYGDNTKSGSTDKDGDDQSGKGKLNRSFSGTY